MSSRLRVTVSEPPHRCISSVDACTLPLARVMTSEWDLRELEDGRTEIRWRIPYTPLPLMRPFLPLIQPFFAWMWRSSMRELGQYLDS